MSTLKIFPLDGTQELQPWNLNLRLTQCEMLKKAGFTHVEEIDIPLSSDPCPIDEYIGNIGIALNNKGD